MKKTLLVVALFVFISINAVSQELTAKEQAELMAKTDFSKSKYKKKEKYGVVKEMSRVVESTPVIKDDLKDYAGIYKTEGPNYIMEIRVNDKDAVEAILRIPGTEQKEVATYQLKNSTIKDALFKAIKINKDETKEEWEGVFINKNDNGAVDFGLGIKLPNPITITEGLRTEKLFFKKVSE